MPPALRRSCLGPIRARRGVEMRFPVGAHGHLCSHRSGAGPVQQPSWGAEPRGLAARSVSSLGERRLLPLRRLGQVQWSAEFL